MDGPKVRNAPGRLRSSHLFSVKMRFAASGAQRRKFAKGQGAQSSGLRSPREDASCMAPNKTARIQESTASGNANLSASQALSSASSRTQLTWMCHT
jgi:hypothetical protein